MNTLFGRFFAWLAFAEVAATALASTYYVSPSGSDAAAGTQSAPFATVQFGVGKLSPGDVLVLRAGDYHEAVTVNRSGTAAAPILIQAFPGETPTLVGSRPVTGTWTVQAGSIYRAPWPTQPVEVFCDGRLLNEARWPNAPLPDNLGEQACALTDDGSINDVVCANLPAVDLTGAWVQIMAGEAWVGYSRQIAAHDRASGRLTFASPINQTSVLEPRRGNRFYVFGKLELLDAPGEWWWDPAGQQLYVWTPDGAPPANRVEAGVADSVLSLSGQSHITVMGLGARGGWFNLQNCTGCVVNGCNLVAPNWLRTFDGWFIWPVAYLGGVDVSGSGNVVQGGSVRLAGRSGVHLTGSDNTVRQILVEDCGWNWTNNAAIDTVFCVRATVENCTILRSSGTGLTMGPVSRFLRNLVDTTAIDFEDCGDIGAWSMDGQGSEIAYNEIHGNHSRWGAGIYLDAGSKNFYVHDNYVHDVQWNGINITGPLRVEHNTFVAVQHQGLGVIPQSSTDGVDMSSGILAHNLAAEPFPIDVSLNQPLSLVPEGASFGTTIPLAPGPRRVEILCSQLVQPGWSQREVPLDLSVVNSVVFNFESPATSYTYSIANLRLLPTGGTGDTGAVPVTGATVQAAGSSGSTCALSTPAASSWSVTGANAFRGANSVAVTLPTGSTDWRTYRGFAFELVGSATRDYKFQGYQDIDNGPDAVPGRGATLPADIGVAATGLGPITPPTVTTQPTSGSYGPGGSVSFTVAASGNPAPTYQWQQLAFGSTVWTDLTEGGSYSGVLGATLTITAPTAVMPGDQFRCVTTSAVGSAISHAATLTTLTAASSHLVTMSTRSLVEPGNNSQIAGFVISGTQPKTVLIRASGPALTAYHVTGVLPDPTLKLFDNTSTVIKQNTGWGSDPSIMAAAAKVGAFAWAAGSADSALLVTLQPGLYTAQVTGASGDSGVALIEVYDADSGSSTLMSISTRSLVESGNNSQIAGFVILGTQPKTVLIRASGPALASHGVTGVLPDPMLKLFDSTSTVIKQNTGWGSDPAITAAAARVGAFTWAAGSADSALLVTLQPGLYTAQVAGAVGDSGVALIEVYDVQ